MNLLDIARSRLGPLSNRLFAAEYRVALSFSEGSNTGPVTRVTGAGATIEAAIDAAAAKLERGKGDHAQT